MRVCQGKDNQQFAAQVQSLFYNTSLSGSVTIPPSIAQLRSKEPFYKHIYPPQLFARVYTTPNTFHDCAILTIYNNTIAKINNAVLMRLYSSLNTFYSIDSIKQNRENDYIELPLAELLQIFNPSNLPLLKLSLKVGTPIILLWNLYPNKGLYNSTHIVITCVGRRCIKTQILGGSFYNQLQLIPYIKLTSTEGELPFIINRRQFPIQLCFTLTVNKLQGQSFNFISVNLYIPVFTYRQLYITLLRVIDIAWLLLLLLQGRDTTITNIIYLEVLLQSQYIIGCYRLKYRGIVQQLWQ